MDRGGTSDPYVLIKQDGDGLYRSNEKKKTVNPVWNDQANVCVENPYTPLVYEVNKCYMFLSGLLPPPGVRQGRRGQ